MRLFAATALLASLCVAGLWIATVEAKMKVGDIERGGDTDAWDEELDKEWEEWEAKTKKKKVKSKGVEPEEGTDPMEMIKRMQAMKSESASGPSDAILATAGSGMVMCFLRLDPRKVKSKEDADELTGRLVSLQRTGGGGDQWYTIDAETLLVNVAKGTDLPEVKNFALTLPEVYEFEWQSNVFRRPEDTLSYNELKASLGMEVPPPPTPPKPPAKKSKKDKKKAKKKGKGKDEL